MLLVVAIVVEVLLLLMLVVERATVLVLRCPSGEGTLDTKESKTGAAAMQHCSTDPLGVAETVAALDGPCLTGVCPVAEAVVTSIVSLKN